MTTETLGQNAPVIPDVEFAPVGQVEIAYDVHGDESDPVLLVVPGLGTQMVYWDIPLIEMLTDRGFRVVRIDNRDNGASTVLRHKGTPALPAMMLGIPRGLAYTLNDMAADAVGVMDHLDVDGAHVIGYSMGGMIAQTMAIEHPDRVLSLTSMMSRTGARLDAFPGVKELAALMRTRPTHTLEGYLAGMEVLAATIGSPDFPTDKDRLRQIATIAYERGIHLDGTARQLHAINCQPRRDRALSRLDIPAVVLHGAADKLVFPRGGRATARAIPGAELRIYEGMGHDIPEQLWPRFVDEIDRVAARAGK
ncbi:MAG: alpha/beta fold hydrolase [Solirubrobacterales bacterium]|nr:alpha/beta fold hydrolase [Solirubrobacterales bacterium]MCB8915930.1 alpha/beta fold hydrolase [Thermoleophilales bacterium]